MNFNEWHDNACERVNNPPTLEEAFEVGYLHAIAVDKELNDPRDVIIARLSIDNERLKTQIQELYATTRTAKDSMHNALREFDKLRFFPF